MPAQSPRLQLGITVLVLALATPLRADTLLLHRRDADEFAFNGRVTGGENQRVEIWLGADRVRRDDGRSVQILRLDQKALFLLDPVSRTFCRVALRRSRGRLGVSKPAVFVQFPAELEIYRLRSELAPEAGLREIGPWQAEGVSARVLSSLRLTRPIRWWTTPDLQIQTDAYKTLLRLVVSLDRGGDAWLDGLLDRPGTLVLFERAEMLPEAEARAREELVSVEEKEPPTGAYEVPRGFRELTVRRFLHENGFPAVL